MSHKKIQRKKKIRPSKKCLSYCRRMISSGKWKVDERIPPLSKIADTLSISTTTVSNVVRSLEREGVLNNYGSMGYFLMPKKQTILSTKNKQLFLLNAVRKHTMVADLLNKGGVIIGEKVVLMEHAQEVLRIVNIINLIESRFSMSEIHDAMNTPLSPEQVLLSKTPRKSQKQYKRQVEILSVMRDVFPYSKKLGLTLK